MFQRGDFWAFHILPSLLSYSVSIWLTYFAGFKFRTSIYLQNYQFAHEVSCLCTTLTFYTATQNVFEFNRMYYYGVDFKIWTQMPKYTQYKLFDSSEPLCLSVLFMLWNVKGRLSQSRRGWFVASLKPKPALYGQTHITHSMHRQPASSRCSAYCASVSSVTMLLLFILFPSGNLWLVT